MRRTDTDTLAIPSKMTAGLGQLMGTLGFTLPWVLGPLAHASVPSFAADGTANPLHEVTVSGVRSLLHDKLAESEQNAAQSMRS